MHSKCPVCSQVIQGLPEDMRAHAGVHCFLAHNKFSRKQHEDNMLKTWMHSLPGLSKKWKD